MKHENTIDGASRGDALTTATPVVAPFSFASGVEPEFVAIPSPSQVCPFSGLKRGALYALANAGLIRTVTLRRKGTTRGRRLIVLQTLKDYLRGLDAEQNSSAVRIQS